MPNIEVTFVALITAMGAQYIVIQKQKVNELVNMILVTTKELSLKEIMDVKEISEALLKEGIETVSTEKDWYFQLISIIQSPC